jgi:hypothetical protein
MSDATRVHVPGYLTFLVAVTLLCCVFVWFYFSGPKISWSAPIFKRPHALEEAQLNRKVWTEKSTGVYYCPDSTLYGHTASGEYMNQGEALQKGYTPALHEPCR